MSGNIKSRVARAARILEKEFGVPQRSRSRDLTGLLVRTILSQNTNDINRDRAYDELRRQFPRWEEVMEARGARIENAIRVGGLAKQKAKNIIGFLKWLKAFRGSLDLGFVRKMSNDAVYDTLCRLNGIGVKTASILLAFGLGRDVFPVDTHVNRISTRLGFVPPKSPPERTHRLMAELVPKGKAYSFHLNLIKLGRKICLARKPECRECPLEKMCPHARSAKADRSD
ncbi:MAG: endonuclease III [Planctomycetota bacterium]